MKIKVSELSGPRLDWAVAMALGIEVRIDNVLKCIALKCTAGEMLDLGGTWLWSPTTSQTQAGKIIDREKIESLYFGAEGRPHPWESQIGEDTHYIDQHPGDAMGGATRLEAAMRCFVESKLGYEVDIPEELA
jgi:hypothetical protein